MGVHTEKSFKVSNKWDIAYRASLPTATTTVELDFSKLKTPTYNKLLKIIEHYPVSPGKGYGWYSEAKKLFNALSQYYCVPNNNVHEYGISLEGILDDGLWHEVWELCYADAIAERMADRGEWCMNNLIRRKDRDKAERRISYWHGSKEFYQEFPKSEAYAKVSAHLRDRMEPTLEKMFETVAYGATIRFQLTK
jgi:hypothetical protein